VSFLCTGMHEATTTTVWRAVNICTSAGGVVSFLCTGMHETTTTTVWRAVNICTSAGGVVSFLCTGMHETTTTTVWRAVRSCTSMGVIVRMIDWSLLCRHATSSIFAGDDPLVPCIPCVHMHNCCTMRSYAQLLYHTFICATVAPCVHMHNCCTIHSYSQLLYHAFICTTASLIACDIDESRYIYGL